MRPPFIASGLHKKTNEIYNAGKNDDCGTMMGKRLIYIALPIYVVKFVSYQ